MKTVIEQLGGTLTTAIVVVLVTVIIGTIALFGTTGLINIAGRESAALADDDTTITDSASVTALNAQAQSATPTLTVVKNPTVNIGISRNDIFAVTGVSEEVDLAVSQITSELNNPQTNVIGSLVTVNGKVLTFSRAGTYYLTVDIRMSNRKMTETFKIIVEEAEEETSVSDFNNGWTFDITPKKGISTGGSIEEGPLGFKITDSSGNSRLIFNKDFNGNNVGVYGDVYVPAGK